MGFNWVYWLVGLVIAFFVSRGLLLMGSSLRRGTQRRAWIDGEVSAVANLSVGEVYTVKNVHSEEDYKELTYQMKSYGAKCLPYDPARQLFVVKKIKGRI